MTCCVVLRWLIQLQAQSLLAEEPSGLAEYVIVMKWASASLQDEMRMKRIAGQNLQAVRHILKVTISGLVDDQRIFEHVACRMSQQRWIICTRMESYMEVSHPTGVVLLSKVVVCGRYQGRVPLLPSLT